MYIKSIAQYRMAFWTSFVGNIVAKLAEYLSIWLILSKFQNMDGWNKYELIMLFNMNQFAISFSGMLFWGAMNQLQEEIRMGTFDLTMIKPVGTFSYVIFKKFDVSFLANLGLSTAIYAAIWNKVGIAWTFLNVTYFVLFQAGAIFIYSALYVLAGSMSFWVIKMGNIFATITEMRQFVYYPLSIYDKKLQGLLTYVIPIAFVNYYPLLYLLNKGGFPFMRAGFSVFCIVLSSFIYYLSYCFWNYSSRRYVGTGS